MMVVSAPAPLRGTKFVLTGSLATPRAAVKERLEALGANVISNVSKHTDYLVAGENAGSKLTRARELGIEVLDEHQLESLIDRALGAAADLSAD